MSSEKQYKGKITMKEKAFILAAMAVLSSTASADLTVVSGATETWTTAGGSHRILNIDGGTFIMQSGDLQVGDNFASGGGYLKINNSGTLQITGGTLNIDGRPETVGGTGRFQVIGNAATINGYQFQNQMTYDFDFTSGGISTVNLASSFSAASGSSLEVDVTAYDFDALGLAPSASTSFTLFDTASLGAGNVFDIDTSVTIAGLSADYSWELVQDTVTTNDISLVVTDTRPPAVAAYNFNSDLSANSSDTNVTAGAFTVGSGLTGEAGRSTSNYAYAFADATDVDLATAINANDYLSFTIQVSSGFKLDLSNLTLRAGYRNSNGSTDKNFTAELLTSIDGFTSSDSVSSVAAVTTIQNGDLIYQTWDIDLSAAKFQTITTDIEFRFYLYDDTSSSSLRHALDDVVLNGTTEAYENPNIPLFATNPIDGGNATISFAYTGSIAGQASDPDGDPLTFSKIDGPAWLQVATDGGLSGTPPLLNTGANSFTVQVTDNDEGSAIATLNIFVNGNPADAIAGFSFDTDLNPTSEGSNVTVSALGAGTGVPLEYYSSGNENAYLDCGDTGLNDLAGAITDHDYMTFTVTPDSGYTMDLTSLSLKVGYTNSRTDETKVLTKSVLSSVDGFADVNLLGTVSTSGTLDSSGDFVYEVLTIDLSALSQFQNITSATEFRIYFQDDTNYNITHRLDDMVLNGKVEPSVIPNAPLFASNPVDGGSASITSPYTGSIAGQASDPDGDPLTFSKIDGPAWLQVATDGALSGTPPPAAMGANSFTVQVSDNDEGSVTAILNIMVNDQGGIAPPSPSAASRIRLVWVNDPSTTVTIAWDQTSGSDAVVKYDSVDYGRAKNFYANSNAVDRSIAYRGMENRFVRLSGLSPDTKYYFVLVDESGVSSRYWFRTAANTPKPFTFIAGGDSRNNRTPRQKANRMVAKLRPLFVSFTGDMINADVDAEWIEWMDDWQQTVSSDGRIYPLLPHRGNHESGGNSTIYNLFDTTSDNYYALTFGGNLLRYYVLNSESGESTQATWMQGDLGLPSNTGITHLMAGYHKPMRPHKTGKPDGSAEYNAWAQLFYDNSFKLVFESDTHTMKRTVAVRPSTEEGADAGFIADTSGTVYVGEGCWGAPLRAADDGKEWTLDMDSFNGFDLVHVYPEQVDVFTVKVDLEAVVVPLADGDELSLPHGINLWEASGGMRLVVSQGASEIKSYAQFQLDIFGGNQPPTGSTGQEDYDGDGISNYGEFAFNMDPTSSSSSPSGMLPGIAIGLAQEKLISYRSRADSTAQFKYYMTQDLSSSWILMEEGTDYNLTVTSENGYEDVELEVIGDAANNERAFYKIEIE